MPILPVSNLTSIILDYDPDADIALIEHAYAFGLKAHEKQIRASGEPYFSHPVLVAEILTALKLDVASIATALLHDTVEDTEVTLEDIHQEFGEEVASLVDGVTKLSRIEFRSAKNKQAENFRKLFLAMSEDIRVLLVKLADRLHNMHTIEHISKEEKRRRIAHETLEIYAPLAERIGMRRMKDELQDMSFAVLQPKARESILQRLDYLRGEAEGTKMVSHIISEIERELHEGGLSDAVVTGREKSPHSIMLKMERKQVGFEQMADIMAFRIMVADVTECYHALGVVHAAFMTVPGKFKDYISTPKENGYQSLHTTVIGPENQRVEIQIRTPMMHEIAERGVAAHWSYKQGEPTTEGKQFGWIQNLLAILEDSEAAEDFLEHTKLEMYHDQVFCFTPRGDLQVLPRGATPVDFAYAIHSDIGNSCVGAKVNGHIVPLRYRLVNGDHVEVLRSKGQHPSPEWGQFVVTGKAKSEVRRYMRTQQRDEYTQLGKAMLERAFRQEEQEISEKILTPVLEPLKRKEIEDIYASIGEGTLSTRQVLDILFPAKKRLERLKRTLSFARLRRSKPRKSGDQAIPVKGLIPGLAVHFAKCCHPIPGDNIVGIVTTGKGVTIHTLDCETLENFSDTPERWLEVSWASDEEESGFYTGRLRVLLSHESGALATMANAIASDAGNITNLNIVSRSLISLKF